MLPSGRAGSRRGAYPIASFTWIIAPTHIADDAKTESWNGQLREGHHPAVIGELLGNRAKIRDLNRTHECIRALLSRKRFRGAGMKTAAWTVRFDSPVSGRQAFRACQRPTDNLPVEFDCAL